MPSIVNEHIFMLNVGDDIDIVLEEFELEVYSVKKNVYSNLKEWDALLDHINDERISEITNNPKGYGDKIMKELLWIRKFEEKHL
jgi:MerR family transcriptional regulator, copper efflux regulator